MVRKNPFIVYLHIEKAAGSTLHNIFLKNIFGYHVFLPYLYDGSRDNQNIFLTKNELARIKKMYPILKGIGGHSIRSYANYEDVVSNVAYITFLRDPIKRFLSHYFYQKEVMSIDWTLDNFIASGHFNNFMCRKICGEPCSNTAINEIKSKYSYVGITETFDLCLVELKSKLRELGYIGTFNINYLTKNARSKRHNSNEIISSSSVKAVKESNIEDVKLFEYVVNARNKKENSLNCGGYAKDCVRFSTVELFNLFSNKLARHMYIKWLERLYRNQHGTVL